MSAIRPSITAVCEIPPKINVTKCFVKSLQWGIGVHVHESYDQISSISHYLIFDNTKLESSFPNLNQYELNIRNSNLVPKHPNLFSQPISVLRLPCVCSAVEA